MAKCEICDKGRIFGRRISITRSQVSRRAKRNWKPNVRRIKIINNGSPRYAHVCTSCIKSNKVTRAI